MDYKTEPEDLRYKLREKIKNMQQNRYERVRCIKLFVRADHCGAAK